MIDLLKKQIKNQIALKMHRMMTAIMHIEAHSKNKEMNPPEKMALSGHILAEMRM